VPDPLIAFARRIARETGRPVPTPNPNGPTTRSLALFVLRDPGATEVSGANETGVLDPYENDDPTSARQRSALRGAGIDPSVCVWWNASPYHVGYKGELHEPDIARGARYLREFVALCPDLRVVVAMGSGAHSVATRAWPFPGSVDLAQPILSPHPMIYGRGGAERRAQLKADLRRAAKLIGA
jgi:hypothetical protein